MKYIFIGLICGFTNGFIGGGAGLITLPILQKAESDSKSANAYTLAAVFAATIVSTVIYYFRGNIDFGASWEYMIGGILSVPIGVMLLKKTDIVILKKMFAVFLIFCGVRMIYA